MTTIPFGQSPDARECIDPKGFMKSEELEKNCRSYLTHAYRANEKYREAAMNLQEFGIPATTLPDSLAINAAIETWKASLVQDIYKGTGKAPPTHGQIESLFEGTGIQHLSDVTHPHIANPEDRVEALVQRGNYKTLRKAVVQIKDRLDDLNPDLFQRLDDLPRNVRELVDHHARKIEQDEGYHHCAMLEADMNAMGYTFEYGLDGVPFNLREGPGPINSEPDDDLDDEPELGPS